MRAGIAVRVVGPARLFSIFARVATLAVSEAPAPLVDSDHYRGDGRQVARTVARHAVAGRSPGAGRISPGAATGAAIISTAGQAENLEGRRLTRRRSLGPSGPSDAALPVALSGRLVFAQPFIDDLPQQIVACDSMKGTILR